MNGSYITEKETYLGGSLNTTNLWGDPGTWGPEIWDKIIKDFKIKSVVDVGAGRGFSARYFSEKGLYAVGVEGGDNAIRNAVHTNMLQHDYTKGYLFTEENEFDLVWCCEFVEHIEEKYRDNFLKDFNKGKYIAVTYAEPGQGGFHHVNCQHQDYWVKLIEERGYKYN